ncbi:4-coumarate--CoA ligase-like 6 [Glycine max]|nr:4-coumarate--CoA ligase-like 6 [Glycine max]
MAASINCDMPLTHHPHCFSPKTGIYHSKHSPVDLPNDPFLDLVSFIFFPTAIMGFRPLLIPHLGVPFPTQSSYLWSNPLLLVFTESVFHQVTWLMSVSLAFTLPENEKKLEPLGISVIAVPENGKGLKDGCFSCFCDLISCDFDLPKRPAIKQDDTAGILFEASQYGLSCLRNVYLAVLPMFHVNGLSLFAVGLLSLGSTVVVMRKFDIDEVVRVIDEYKVIHFPVVPPMLTALITRANGVNGGESLVQVSSSAAPLSTGVINEFIRAFPNVDFIQGMTESTAVGTRGFNTEKFLNYSSIGLLAPNMEAKVVDWNTGAFLPPGSSGELWLRGPSIMTGSKFKPHPLSPPLCWFGFFLGQQINTFRSWQKCTLFGTIPIAPANLDAVLSLHPEIVDVAVTGAMDEETGEMPAALVVRKVGSVLSPKRIMDFVAELVRSDKTNFKCLLHQLATVGIMLLFSYQDFLSFVTLLWLVAPYKKVRKVFFTDKIPRSATGKILRKQLSNCSTSKL